MIIILFHLFWSWIFLCQSWRKLHLESQRFWNAHQSINLPDLTVYISTVQNVGAVSHRALDLHFLQGPGNWSYTFRLANHFRDKLGSKHNCSNYMPVSLTFIAGEIIKHLYVVAFIYIWPASTNSTMPNTYSCYIGQHSPIYSAQRRTTHLYFKLNKMLSWSL